MLAGIIRPKVYREKNRMWQAIKERLQAAKPSEAQQNAELEAQHLREQCQALTRQNDVLESALARFSSAITPKSPGTSPPRVASNIIIDEKFRSYYRGVLLDTFYKDNPMIDITNEEVFARDLDAHTERRFRVFENLIESWLKIAAPNMHEMTAIEIGSGTGSSTLAFASQVKKLVSFEIDGKATDAAEARLHHFGLNNVDFRRELFSPEAEIVKSGEPVHMIVLCAVLEHMTLAERREALQTAWKLLVPGGFLVVTDTPNRFAVFDDHTSLLPYYSALPPDIQREYIKFSPRKDLVTSIANTHEDDIAETITRWGSGISYHDFELAIGKDIHRNIILDGYEPSLIEHYPDRIDDALLRVAFQHYEIPAHRAFTRHNLHFVVQKPSD